MAFAILRRHAPDCNPGAVATPSAPSRKPGYSPVMALFVQWRDLLDHLNSDASISEAQIEAGCTELHELKEAMFREPSRDAQDHLAKVVASTSWGKWDLEKDGSPEFWAEARALMSAA